VARGLFDEEMRPGLDCRDGLQRVPVVWRSDDDDLWFLLFQKFTVGLVSPGLGAAEVVHLFNGDFEFTRVNVAQRDELHPPAGQRLLENVLAPPTATDQGGAMLVARLGAEQRHGVEGETGGGSGLERMTTGQLHIWFVPPKRYFFP